MKSRMKTTPEIDRQVYELARSYLPSLNITRVTQALIEKYRNPLSLNPKPASKEELYYHSLPCQGYPKINEAQQR